MNVRRFKRGVFLVFCIMLTLSLVACALPDWLGNIVSGDDPSNTETTRPSNFLPSSVERKNGVYTILLLNEQRTIGNLASVFLCSVDTAGNNGVSFLQIPVKTYVHNAYSSIAGVFSGAYSSSIAQGNTADRARESAILAVKSVIESHFCVYVDYYICANPEQLGVLTEKIGGIDINVPYSMLLNNGATLAPGKQSLEGGNMAAFLSYSGFSDSVLMNAYKTVIAAIYSKAKTQVTNDTVSLFVLEIRNCIVTDIPSNGGEDIFFTRRLLETDSSRVRFTQVASQSCAVPAGLVEVIRKSEAIKVINEYLGVYTDELTTDMFDPQKMFTDDTNQLVAIIYKSSGGAPQIYTAQDISDGLLPLT